MSIVVAAIHKIYLLPIVGRIPLFVSDVSCNDCHIIFPPTSPPSRLNRGRISEFCGLRVASMSRRRTPPLPPPPPGGPSILLDGFFSDQPPPRCAGLDRKRGTKRRRPRPRLPPLERRARAPLFPSLRPQCFPQADPHPLHCHVDGQPAGGHRQREPLLPGRRCGKEAAPRLLRSPFRAGARAMPPARAALPVARCGLTLS